MFAKVIPLVLLLLETNMAWAAKVDMKVNSNDLSQESSAYFATIAPASQAIVLIVENAKVQIIRTSGINEIGLHSNCPRNWHVQGSLIRQCGFAKMRKGAALLADGLGSRAIVNGQVYVFPPGPLKGLKMGTGGVFINGERIEPLKGSDMPGSCSGEDLLEIKVPESFAGDLRIAGAGDSEIILNSWKGGVLECALTGNSSLSAGKLDSLAKAVFDNHGQGKASVADVSTQVFVANVTGNGQVFVKKGTAQVSNATVSGSGTISLYGNFKNMKKQIDGQGSIEISP